MKNVRRNASEYDKKVVHLSTRHRAASASTCRIGTIVDVCDHSIVVTYPENPHGPVPARLAVPISEDDLRSFIRSEQPVLLGFDGGRSNQPIVTGVIQPVLRAAMPTEVQTARTSVEGLDSMKAVVDGREVLLHGAERVELRCGKASIILTKAGKVLIRGAYVSTRSSGANRVRGASVEIN